LTIFLLFIFILYIFLDIILKSIKHSNIKENLKMNSYELLANESINKNVVEPKVNMISIDVKMGSNKMSIELPSTIQGLKSAQLIEMVLKKCRLSGSENLIKTYRLFESINGVEQLIKRDRELITLCNEMKSNQGEAFFVVRKLKTIEKRLGSKTAEKQLIMAQKCYKKLKAQSKREDNVAIKQKNKEQEKESKSVEHKLTTDEREYYEKIIQNELTLEKQAKKLIKVEKSIHKRLVSLENRLIENLSSQNKNLKQEEDAEKTPANEKLNQGLNDSKIYNYMKTKFSQTIKQKLVATPSKKQIQPALCVRHQKELNARLAFKFLFNKMSQNQDEQTEYLINQNFSKINKPQSISSSRSSSTSTLESLV